MINEKWMQQVAVRVHLHLGGNGEAMQAELGLESYEAPQRYLSRLRKNVSNEIDEQKSDTGNGREIDRVREKIGHF